MILAGLARISVLKRRTGCKTLRRGSDSAAAEPPEKDYGFEAADTFNLFLIEPRQH